MLLGRSRELDAVSEGLQSTAAGRGRAFALVGEPGIGKTSLATAAAARATALGMTEAWGRAWESGGAPAYWPWRQLLEAVQPSLSGERPDGPLRLLWANAPAGEFSTSDPGQARFEVFDAVTRRLREAARVRPLLCVLEDLHVADVASVELATFAMNALAASPVAWVVTYRDAEAEQGPARDALARLSRRATVLALARLTESESAELVRGLIPGAKHELEVALFHATNGNPLFLRETARAVADGRAATLGQLPVAQGVALVVRERFAALSPGARSLAEAGAVIGREVSAVLLAAAERSSAAEVHDRAREVVAGGLWREVEPGRWQFSHALVRDALYRALEHDRRRTLHAHVADAGSEHPLARAHHALEALPKLDAARAAAWVLEAARQARAQRAYEQVVTLLERAVRDLPGNPELILELGWAYSDLGDTGAVVRTFDRALALARQSSDRALLARAVLGRGSVYVFGTVRTELIGLIDEALAGLPDGPIELVARLTARKASALTPAAVPSEPLRLARAALAAVASTTDARAQLDVAVAAGSALGEFAPPAERIEVNTTLVRLARGQGDRVLEVRGLSRLVADHLEAGDVSLADAVLLERDALVSALGHAHFRWTTPIFRAMRAMLEGRFDVCDTAYDEARALVDAADDANARRSLAVHRLFVLLLQDRIADARALEPELLRRIDDMPNFPALVRAVTAARSGQVQAAHAQLDRIGTNLHHLHSCNMLSLVAEAAVLCGHREVAAAAYALLEPRSESNSVFGLFGPTCGVPVQALLGYLGHFLGRPPAEVTASFDAALARTEAMGARAHEVWVRFWLGQLTGSRDELEASARLARELNMLGVAERAAAALAATPAAAAPAAAPAPALAFSLKPHDGGWKLERGSTVLVLKGLRGMAMLARLLEQPGEEVHSQQLVAGDAEGDSELPDAGDAGELLDEKARQQYRRRIEQLSERIEDSEERGDALGAERARTELEALSRELSRAVGLGGRARRAGSAAERARTTAQRRLREAIKRIGELDREVGDHLARTIRTGLFCAYEPNRRARR